MTISDAQQRSADWYNARRGLPTCSRFDRILTAVQGKRSSAQDALIDELIAESILPPTEGLIHEHVTEEMMQGMKLEAEARCLFELEYAKAPVSEVGFIMHKSGLFGGSPDALIGEDGGLEIKCVTAKVHVGYIRGGILPSEHRLQVEGSLVVTGRDYWSFFSYCRHFKPFHVVTQPSDFTKRLEEELYLFCEKYNAARALFGLKPIGNNENF